MVQDQRTGEWLHIEEHMAADEAILFAGSTLAEIGGPKPLPHRVARQGALRLSAPYFCRASPHVPMPMPSIAAGGSAPSAGCVGGCGTSGDGGASTNSGTSGGVSSSADIQVGVGVSPGVENAEAACAPTAALTAAGSSISAGSSTAAGSSFVPGSSIAAGSSVAAGSVGAFVAKLNEERRAAILQRGTLTWQQPPPSSIAPLADSASAGGQGPTTARPPALAPVPVATAAAATSATPAAGGAPVAVATAVAVPTPGAAGAVAVLPVAIATPVAAPALPNAPARVKACYFRLDTDDDGRITLEELCTGLANELYAGSDVPGAPVPDSAVPGSAVPSAAVPGGAVPADAAPGAAALPPRSLAALHSLFEASAIGDLCFPERYVDKRARTRPQVRTPFASATPPSEKRAHIRLLF